MTAMSRLGKALTWGGLVVFLGVCFMALTLVHRPDDPTFTLILRCFAGASIAAMAFGMALIAGDV